MLLIAALVLPVLVFAGASWLSYRAHFREAHDRLARTLDVVHEHAVKVFETQDLAADHVNQIVFGLSDDEVRAREPSLSARLKALDTRLEQINDIWVLDRDGHPLVTANLSPVPRDLDLSDRIYFRVHRDGIVPAGRPYFSEVLRGRANPNTTFFQVSIRRSAGPGEGHTSEPFIGVTALSIEPLYFRRFYREASRSGVDAITMVRDDGAILARYPDVPDVSARMPKGTPLMDVIAQGGERGFFETTSTVDGKHRLYAYQHLPGLPVYVTTGIDRSTVLAEWAGTMASHLLFGLPATAGLVLLALLALRRTRREALALAQVRAETARREETEAQLRQAQKMEAVGRLTGGIAHDFNNLLQVVTGSLDLLKRRMTNGDERQHRLVDNALVGAHRAANLTARLLAFSRQQPLDPKPLDVNRLVAGMHDLLARTLGATVRIETVLAGGLWRISADPNQLESAILNLAVNARDAMGEAGGRLTIETANAHLDEVYAATRPDVRAGQYVMIAVTDTGSGMSPDVISRAFEPFYTTKEIGKGTGLGLSQVYGFAKQSGGHAAIYSEVGQGTCVKLYFPRLVGAEATVAADAATPHLPLPTRGSGSGPTVLVVEDTDEVRHVTAEALRELGYRVLEAGGAAPALDLLGVHPEVALLLTDVVMPDVNGRQLAEEALRRRPDLSVVFMTGYSRNAIVHNGALDPGTHLITKPFTAPQLGAKLDAVLSTPAAGQLTPPSPGPTAFPGV